MNTRSVKIRRNSMKPSNAKPFGTGSTAASPLRTQWEPVNLIPRSPIPLSKFRPAVETFAMGLAARATGKAEDVAGGSFSWGERSSPLARGSYSVAGLTYPDMSCALSAEDVAPMAPGSAR
jgi:hypothetical protein